MTNKEKEALVKAAFPGIEGMSLTVAVGFVEDDDTVDSYKKRIKVAPEVLGGSVISGKDVFKLGKAAVDLGKAAFAKKATTEGAEAVAKAGGKKFLTKKKVIGGVAIGGAAEIYNRMSKDGGTGQTPEEMAQASLAMAAATLQESGGDPNSILGTPLAQQMNITTGSDLSTLASSLGITLDSSVGVYTGESTKETIKGPKGRTYPKVTYKTQSLSDWNKQFPIANPTELAAFKQKVIAAGVVSAGAGVTQLKAAWEALGQLSVDAARSGARMTPWQMLDIQRGLFGGGDENAPSYSLTYTPAEQVKNIYGSAIGAGTGKVASAEEEAAFVKSIKAKEGKAPTKSETKIINGKKVRVTTPGFTDADILTAAEQQAQKDPRYAEYQTATVFGDALSKALGVRG